MGMARSCHGRRRNSLVPCVLAHEPVQFGVLGGANPQEAAHCGVTSWLLPQPRIQGGPMSEENADDQRDTREFGAAAPPDRAGSDEPSAHAAAQDEAPAQGEASTAGNTGPGAGNAAAAANTDTAATNNDAAAGNAVDATDPGSPDDGADQDTPTLALSLQSLGVRGSKG